MSGSNRKMTNYERWDLIINGSLAFLTLLTLGFLVFGLNQTRQALESSSSAAAYNHMREVTKLFVEKPYLRPYFYGNGSIDARYYDNEPLREENVKEFAEVEAASEQLLDQFDLLVEQFRHFVEDDSGWYDYMIEMFNTSAALCEYLDRYPDWYKDSQGKSNVMDVAVQAPTCLPRLDGKSPSGRPW